MAKKTSKASKVVVQVPGKRGAAKASAHSIYHKDGSIYGKGQMLDGKMHGYWEFYRKDGSVMRSGSFDREQQIGTWTTYDAGGKPIKVTEMKPKRVAVKAAQSRKS